MTHLQDKPDPKYEELQKRLNKAIAYNCAITSGIGMVVFLVITFISIAIISISQEMHMRDDVSELSEICDLAIEALVCEDEDSGELIIEAASKVDEIKKKYSIE